MARFARKLDGSEPASLYQSVLLAKDGRRVPFEANSEVILRDGALYGVMVIARDVRERDRAWAASDERERLFSGVFDGVAVGMVITDPDSTVVQANVAFATMLGYDPAELVGMSVREIVHPDDRNMFVQDIEKMSAGGEHGRVVADRRYVRKDGEVIFIHASASAISGGDGSTQLFAAQIEDVTELRRAQAELQESQALHRLVIESSYDVLAVLDLDGTIRLVSRSSTTIMSIARSNSSW